VKPINFKEQNMVFAENQKEYLPLPAHKTKEGQIISCWKMSFRERIKALFTGRVYSSIHTFNNGLPPQMLSVNSIFEKQK